MEAFTVDALVYKITTRGLRHSPLGLYIKIKTEQRHEETYWHYADRTDPELVWDGPGRHEWRRGSVNRNGGRRAVRGQYF